MAAGGTTKWLLAALAGIIVAPRLMASATPEARTHHDRWLHLGIGPGADLQLRLVWTSAYRLWKSVVLR